MASMPSNNPKPHMGVEIYCTWPIGAFQPGALRNWSDQETYEAYPRPDLRVAARTLREIRSLISRSKHLRPADTHNTLKQPD
jgi:hypothetical protein